MSENKTKKGDISRRQFMKRMGVGVASGYVVSPTLIAAPALAIGPEEELPQTLQELTLKVNGKRVRVMVEPRTTLAELVREHLHLTGTKIVCNAAECGNCTVLLDGKAVYACHTLALDAAGKEVTTIEGLLSGEELHPVQKAFHEHDGYQCGFCTPGQIMAAHALLLQTPKPTREKVLKGMSGNICRCAAYPKIIDSVMAATETTGSF